MAHEATFLKINALTVAHITRALQVLQVLSFSTMILRQPILRVLEDEGHCRIKCCAKTSTLDAQSKFCNTMPHDYNIALCAVQGLYLACGGQQCQSLMAVKTAILLQP